MSGLIGNRKVSCTLSPNLPDHVRRIRPVLSATASWSICGPILNSCPAWTIRERSTACLPVVGGFRVRTDRRVRLGGVAEEGLQGVN